MTATHGIPARVADSPSRERGPEASGCASLAALLAAVVSGLAVLALAPSDAGTAGCPADHCRWPTTASGTSPTGQHMIAISPEGTRFVYVARGRLFLRDLSQFEARVVSVTNAGPGVHTLSFHQTASRWPSFPRRSDHQKRRRQMAAPR